MRSTTYIAEITDQKNEKYLSEGKNPFACLPPRLVASCQLRNFPHEFTKKCFAVFDQSSREIYLTWYFSIESWISRLSFSLSARNNFESDVGEN